MGIFLFKCEKCDYEFEEIVSYKAEFTLCKKCFNESYKINRPLLTYPAQIEAGVGGVHRPKWGEMKYK